MGISKIARADRRQWFRNKAKAEFLDHVALGATQRQGPEIANSQPVLAIADHICSYIDVPR